MTQVTRILNLIEAGDPAAADDLLPLVYDELRNLAKARMQHENPGHSLGATALVHEAYMRLVGNDKGPDWDNKGHFFAAAAEAMRRILIDRARQKKSWKRGGDRVRVDLDDPAQLGGNECFEQFLALDVALEKLEKTHPRKAQLVKLRYFAGLTIADAADALGVARSTADADWAFARSWLKLELS